MVQGFGGVPVIDGGGYWAVSFFYGEDKNSVLRNFMLTNSYMGIFVAGSSPKISNVNIVGNMFGIEAYSGANPDVVNCILWNNTDGDIFGCQPRFSCIEREEQAGGEGNITASPLFADSGAGDYRLRSQLGRYMPQLDLWVVDEITSPCVNAGDPSVNPGNEPMPNGGRINIGAYGDTSQASRGQWVLTGDLNKDGVVDMSDLAILEENWLLRLGWVETQ
jgi:hypothetical protein